MRRRTWLRWIASLSSAIRFSELRAWAQTETFPGSQGATLAALAEIVLPGEIGPDGVHAVAHSFERWVREYRAGAEMDHGYGLTRIRSKAASPAPGYLRQLEALGPALAGREAAQKRRALEVAVEAAIEAAKVTDLPRTPDGRHVATDLMAFYFRGNDANDLCYRAAIGRDRCRGLEGSDQPPTQLKPAAELKQ